MFALNECRCPQPSPNNPSGRAAEPFGDDAKRFAKLNVGQRSVEIVAEGLTNGGVVTGKMYVGGGAKRENFAKQLLSSGLGSIDYRDVDSTAPDLVAAMESAKSRKAGIWSVEGKLEASAAPVKKEGGQPEEVKTVRVSEIRDGNHFFFHEVGDEAVAKISSAMEAFKEQHGVSPGPVTLKKGKVVAALFDDGSAVGWYRAKFLEVASPGTYRVLYIDHGNVGLVTSKDVRPLDGGLESPPPCSADCRLALTRARDLGYDEGVAAARLLSRMSWGKELTARVHGSIEGSLYVTLYDPSSPTSINEALVGEGLARAAPRRDAEGFGRETQPEAVKELWEGLTKAQDKARKERVGIWIYGDVGEDDDEAARY